MITRQHIDLSIQRALEGQSNLSQSQLEVRGFSTPTIRRLINHICNIEGGGTYLEVGLFCGGTFVSSFNPNTVSIGIENYAQDFSVPTVKEELEKNIDNHVDRAKEVIVHLEDCFKIDLSLLPNNIDIIFYDGVHDFESQRRALPHFFDKMADVFLFLVDDTTWQEVARGTEAGLSEMSNRFIIEGYWPLRGLLSNDDPIWHNGVNLYLLRKTK